MTASKASWPRTSATERVFSLEKALNPPSVSSSLPTRRSYLLHPDMILARRPDRAIHKNRGNTNTFIHPGSKLFLITDIRRIKSPGWFRDEQEDETDEEKDAPEATFEQSLSSLDDISSTGYFSTSIDASSSRPSSPSTSIDTCTHPSYNVDQVNDRLSSHCDLVYYYKDNWSVMVVVPKAQAAVGAGAAPQQSSHAPAAGPSTYSRPSPVAPPLGPPPITHPYQHQPPPNFSASAPHPIAAYYASMAVPPPQMQYTFPIAPFGPPAMSPMLGYHQYPPYSGPFTPPIAASTPSFQQGPSRFPSPMEYPRRSIGGDSSDGPSRQSPTRSSFGGPTSRGMVRNNDGQTSSSPFPPQKDSLSLAKQGQQPASWALTSSSKPILRPDVKAFEPTTPGKVASPAASSPKAANNTEESQKTAAAEPHEDLTSKANARLTIAEEDLVLKLPIWAADDAEVVDDKDLPDLTESRPISTPASRDPWASSVSAQRQLVSRQPLTLSSRTISRKGKLIELGTPPAHLTAD